MMVNINCVLKHDCEQKCKEINNKICNLVGSRIDFKTNQYRPHITILAGEIRDEDFSSVNEIVRNLKYAVLNRKIAFNKPCYKYDYIMYDVRGGDIEPFKHDCQMLINALKNHLTPREYTISNGQSTPHISISYHEGLKNPDEILKLLPLLEPTEIESVTLSKEGNYGTALI